MSAGFCRITERKGKKLKPHKAMLGCPVCYRHGGNLPQVRAAAQRRIAQATIPELTALARKAIRNPRELNQLRQALSLAGSFYKASK